jgi:ceramide glucosyltransferase
VEGFAQHRLDMLWYLIPASLLAVQSVWSLADGFRFLKLVRRDRGRSPDGEFPEAAVIVPCKGLTEDLRRNAALFLDLDYPSCQLIFVVASERDPAYRFLLRLIEDHAPKSRSSKRCTVVVGGFSASNGEKVNNLLAGVAAVDPAVKILAFSDIDAKPEKDWLRFLVAPLSDRSVTASTGYRWYLPSVGFGSRLRAAWDTSIATMMGDHSHHFAWGGSMALRVEDFKRMAIAERYWQQTVSDDYALTRAVRDAGGQIRFVSRCLVASKGECSLGEFWRWSTRQIVITRVYAARYWVLGLASHGLYAVTLLWGLGLLILPELHAVLKLIVGGFMLSTVLLGVAKGWLRVAVGRVIFPHERPLIERFGACYWQLAPVVPWIMLLNFAVAGFKRRIEWSGTVYELRSALELKVFKP